MSLITNPSTVNIASSTPHGINHLAANPALYEPQRTNNFELVILGVENLVRAGLTGNETNSIITNAQETLRLALETCPIPSFEVSTLEIQRGNNKIKFAGIPTYSGGTFTFNDYIGAETKDALYAWQACVYNYRTEKVGLMQDYKKSAYLLEYSPDMQLVRRYVMEGLWIKSVSDSNRDHGGNAVNKITAAFEYDRAYPDVSETL